MLTCIAEAHLHTYILPQLSPPFPCCYREQAFPIHPSCLTSSYSVYPASNNSHANPNIYLPLFKPHLMCLLCFLIRCGMMEVDDWNNREYTSENTNSCKKKNLDFNSHTVWKPGIILVSSFSVFICHDLITCHIVSSSGTLAIFTTDTHDEGHIFQKICINSITYIKFLSTSLISIGERKSVD